MLIAISHPHRVVARPAFRSTPRLPIRSSVERQQRREHVAIRSRAMSERERERRCIWLRREGREGGSRSLFSRAKRSRKARENARKVVQSDDDDNDDDDDDDDGGGCLRSLLPSFVCSFVRSFVRCLPSASAFITPRHDAAQRRRVVDSFVGAVRCCMYVCRCVALQ